MSCIAIRMLRRKWTVEARLSRARRRRHRATTRCRRSEFAETEHKLAQLRRAVAEVTCHERGPRPARRPLRQLRVPARGAVQQAAAPRSDAYARRHRPGRARPACVEDFTPRSSSCSRRGPVTRGMRRGHRRVAAAALPNLPGVRRLPRDMQAIVVPPPAARSVRAPVACARAREPDRARPPIPLFDGLPVDGSRSAATTASSLPAVSDRLRVTVDRPRCGPVANGSRHGRAPPRAAVGRRAVPPRIRAYTRSGR